MTGHCDEPDQADGPEAVVTTLYRFLGGDRSVAPYDLMTEDFQGETTRGLPEGLGGHFDGREAMLRQVWGRTARLYEMVPEVTELRRVDDSLVVARGVYRGSARATGKPVEAVFAHFWSMRDGRVSGVQQITDSVAWAEALVAE